MKEVDKLQKPFRDVSLCEIRESICVESKNITLILGKEYHAEIDGSSVGIRWLRPLYTHNKEEFDSLLESLKSSANEVAEAQDILLAAVADEAIPGAVIARMKGEQVDGGSSELVESLVKKKLDELLTLVAEAGGAFDRFIIDLPVAGKDLALQYQHPDTHLKWGEVAVYKYGHTTSNIEGCLKFLASFDSIKAKLLAFCNIIRATKKMGKKRN